LIKFLNKKQNILVSKPLVVTQLKVFGCNHDQFELYEELKQIVNNNILFCFIIKIKFLLIKKQSLPKSLNEFSNERSNSILVNAVLWFLCQLAEQNVKFEIFILYYTS